MNPLSLAFRLQAATNDGFMVNLTPAILVALVGLLIMALVNVVAVVSLVVTMKAKITEHDAHLISLRADRHDAKERLLVLESRVDATDKEFDRQRDEERDLRVAVSELLQQRRTA